MRVLFLDIDEVLNSNRSAVGLGGIGSMPPRIMKMRLDAIRDYAMWDPVAVGILKRIIKETLCFVVVSSTWRLGSTVSELRRLFEAHGISPGIIIDRTGSHPTAFRGREIRAWLKEHGTHVKDYLILDDGSDFFRSQKSRHVKVSPAVGLDYDAYRFIYERWGPKPRKKRSVTQSL